MVVTGLVAVVFLAIVVDTTQVEVVSPVLSSSLLAGHRPTLTNLLRVAGLLWADRSSVSGGHFARLGALGFVLFGESRSEELTAK